MGEVDLLGMAIFIISAIYFILGWIAYSSVEHQEDKWNFSITVWPFFKREYNDIGKSLCTIGKLIFFVIIISTIYWLIKST